MIDAAAAAAKVTLPDRGWLLSIRKTIEIDIHIDRNNMVRIRVRACHSFWHRCKAALLAA